MRGLIVFFRRFLRILFCLVLTCWMASSAFGQAGRGRITGLITDPTGAAVPAATIVLLNPDTGVTLTAQTTGSGLYSFGSLNPGTYNVTVSKKGFATIVQKSVAVQVDQTTAVNLTLQPGAVHQVVTVTSAAPLAATTNTTVGQLISEETIQRVPLVDRDVFKLVQLSPGITPVNGAVNNVEFNQRPGADVSGFSINGLPQGTLAYLEDGAPLTIAENNLGAMIPAMIPPLESIQEYSIETNNVPATTQSFGTGVLSLVSKSGTNKFHGSGFFYGRPNFWAANDPFVKASQLQAGEPNQAPDFHRYQWGASIGGPIKRNKVFFFGDYEGTTQRALDTASYTVPTMAERGGDFSADSFTVYNPFDVVGGARQPFANNVIPGNMINSIAQQMAQFYPKPNQPGVGPYHVRNFFGSGLDPNDEQKFDVR
ncbi:MAG TPA: carboxypeptidase regulatory-like domain-containing protein, partial [Terriglobia bacterium]|nr:carboxypeptidase regulatory-like domain-containing protein [Terriglobia bacterium]